MIRKLTIASILAAVVAAPAFAGPVYWHAAPYRYYPSLAALGPHYVGPAPRYCCYRGVAVGVTTGVAVGLVATAPRVITPVYAPVYTPPPRLVLSVPHVVYAAPPLRGYYYVP